MIDSIFIYKILIDFGLLILIIMVQLTIYPSFLYYKREDLFKWHKKYTSRIAIIVGPLMIAQLFLAVYIVFGKQQYLIGGIHLALVLTAWASTALQFVPIHNRIANGIHTKKDLQDLVNKNWLRVVLWLMVFGLSWIHYLSPQIMNDLLLD